MCQHKCATAITRTTLKARPNETTIILWADTGFVCNFYQLLCKKHQSTLLVTTRAGLIFHRCRDGFAQICRRTRCTPFFLLLSHTCIYACI